MGSCQELLSPYAAQITVFGLLSIPLPISKRQFLTPWNDPSQPEKSTHPVKSNSKLNFASLTLQNPSEKLILYLYSNCTSVCVSFIEPIALNHSY
jgi:hypothetical protein